MKILFQCIILLFPVLLQSQYVEIWDRPIYKLTTEIHKGTSWDEILKLVENDSILSKQDYSLDIGSTVKFLNEDLAEENIIDDLMYSICTEHNYRFKFSQSGNLNNNYKHYKAVNRDRVSKEIQGEEIDGKDYVENNYSFSKILKSTKENIIPRLIHYLNNNSATRQIVGSVHDGDIPYYISVADIAMEFLEVYTLCDFYSSYVYGDTQLFSNRTEQEKMDLVQQIKRWWKVTKEMDRVEATNFFLDSINNNDNSYFYTCNYTSFYNTCNNIFDYGDTLLATARYRQLYDNYKLPCRRHYDVGERLFALGDKILMEDCKHDITNFGCTTNGSSQCIRFIIDKQMSDYSYLTLAEVVATEIHSTHRRNKNQFLWHTIFQYMAETETELSNLILLELLKIKEVVKGSRIYAAKWKEKYPNEFENNFRVCDFALIKYAELNPKAKIELNWKDKKSINIIIENLIKNNGG